LINKQSPSIDFLLLSLPLTSGRYRIYFNIFGSWVKIGFNANSLFEEG
jgi:hypothetical protein